MSAPARRVRGPRGDGLPWWGVAGVTVVAVALGIGAAYAVDASRGADGLFGAGGEPSPSPTVVAGPVVPSVTAQGEWRAEPVPSIGVKPVFNLELYSIDDPASPWVIVNKRRPLDPQDYVPADLTSLRDVPGGGSQSMRRAAADALESMYAASRAAGAAFTVTTAYRSYSYQAGLYNGYVNERGRAVADSFSARPGHSEHQTGWAVDACDVIGCRHTTSFGSTTPGRWLGEHCWEYGFIIRYGPGQTAVTGYIQEPWHLRYVGPELAKYWHEQGRPPLEEVFSLEAAPTY